MRTIDVAIVLAYLAAVIAAGLAFRGRQATADEYFTARGRFRGMLGQALIGLSIAATLFSGASLVVYVSVAFSDGAQIALGAVCLPVAWIVLHFWFLPRYMAGRWEHPYSVVEARFGGTVRLALSALFMLLRVGWMGVLIYVPALIVSGVAGIDDRWFWLVALGIGLSSTLYTVIGGMRSVIVTDAIQFVVIIAGLAFILGSIISGLDVGVSAAARELASAGRLDVLDFSLDLTRPFTFFSIVVGLSVANLGSYAADQMSLQRYLAADSPRAATRAFLVNLAGAASLIAVLVSVGLLLWLWYRHHPDPQLPVKPDQVLPYFIATQLPAGVSGLLVASILAATMSSVTSGINAIAGALTNEWFCRLGRRRSPEALYLLGRRTSLAVGVASTLLALVAGRLGSALQSSQILMGGFLGSMLACMILAVSTVPARPAGVLWGMAAGLAAGWCVAGSPLSSLWISPAAFAAAMFVPLAHVAIAARPGGRAAEIAAGQVAACDKTDFP